MTMSVFGEVADDPALDGLEGRVAQQVAAEQAARLDAVGLEERRSARARVKPASGRTVITKRTMTDPCSAARPAG